MSAFFLVPFEKPSFLFCVPIIFTASSSILQSRSTAKVATATRGIKARKCVLELQLLALTVLISQLLPLLMFLFFLLSLVYMKRDHFYCTCAAYLLSRRRYAELKKKTIIIISNTAGEKKRERKDVVFRSIPAPPLKARPRRSHSSSPTGTEQQGGMPKLIRPQRQRHAAPHPR